MIASEKYSNYNYGFPKHDVSPEIKKGRAYSLAFCKAFYSFYLKDDLITRFNNRRDEIFTLRKYAVGDQSEELYMELCYGKNEGAQTIRKGWMNVNWEILKIAQKYRNAFLGMFNDIDFDVTCESQDRYSKKEKEKEGLRLYAQKKLRPMLQQAGINVPESEKPEPDTLEELKVYQELGFYKNQVELAFEKFMKEVFYTFSNWELETKRMVLEDLWDCGEAMVRDCVDKNTQKLKVEYCDIANAIVRKDNDGRILDGGVIKIKSISDVRAEAKECGVDFTEDQLKEAARSYVGHYNNPSKFDESRDSELYEDNNGILGHFYDNWNVAVLECEYRTSDIQYYTRKERNGKTTYEKAKYGKDYGTYDESKKKKYKTIKTTEKKNKINYYRAKWILGTDDLIYDYGQQYDIPRPYRSEACSSYHYVKLPGHSPVKTIRPVLDQVQLSWVKFQNAWAKAKPEGYAYDESVLQNATIGKKLTPDEIINMSEQTGRLFYKSVDKLNHPTMSPNAGNPIFPMPGGIGSALNEFVATWNLMIAQLQELTGITPQAAASPLPADTGKAVSEIQLAATSNILKPIINEYKRLKQSVSKTLALRGIIVFKYNKSMSKEYYDILGEDTVELIKIMTKSPAQIGINMVQRTNTEMRAKLDAAAQRSMQKHDSGGVGITLSQYLTLTMLIENNASPKYIQAILSKMESERMMQMEQQKQQLIEMQNQGNQQAAMVATEGKKSEMTHEVNEQIRLETAKGFLDIIKEREKAGIQTDMDAYKMLIDNMLSPLLQEQIAQAQQAQQAQQGQQPPKMP